MPPKSEQNESAPTKEAEQLESGGSADDDSESKGKSRRRALTPIAIAAGVLTIVVVAVLLTPAKPGSSVGGDGPPSDAGVAQIGSQAPDFKLKTIDGSTFRLAEHRGKVILINFWGTWCPPCEKEMPHLVEVHSRYRESTVFVAVAVNDVPDAVRKFVAEKHMDFPVGLDEGQIAGRYLVSGFPTTVIVGTDGVVREKVARAFPDVASIEGALNRAGATPDAAIANR